MKRLCLLILLISHLQAARATVWYVRSNATGTNNGSSWINAFTNLQSGIAATSAGDSIWVANGTYKPTTTANRYIYFVMPSGVGIFGGFAGTETALSQRNYSSYQTILSGDIGQPGLHTDNSIHVVTATSVSTQTRLDGFKIIYGHADGSSIPLNSGGGFYSSNGSPTVANCLFTENFANAGGGLRHHETGVINILNCNFASNTAGSGGAVSATGVNVWGTINIRDCNISGNQATGTGGGLDFFTGNVNIDRCVISGNTSGSYGGAMYVEDPTLTITNSLIAGNTGYNFCLLYQDFNNPYPISIINTTIAHNRNTDPGALSKLINFSTSNTLRNSIIWGNSTLGFSNYQPIISNSLIQNNYAVVAVADTLNPRFVSPAIAAQAPFLASGFDYHLGALSHAIDTGNNADIPPLATLDLGGSARISGNKVDLGAYEHSYCTFSPTVTPPSPNVLCPGATLTLTASGGTTYYWSNGSNLPTLVVSNAGVRTVTALNGSGCRGIVRSLISPSNTSLTIVSPAPATQLCPGDTKLITASGNNLSSFSWNTAATTAGITISAPGQYTVTATGGDGCILKDSILIVQAAVPQPLISNNAGILTTANFSAYQWQLAGADIPGANFQSWAATANGVYTVRVSNTAGCVNTSPQITVSNVGIDGLLSSNGILAYPNPARGSVTIRLPQQIAGETEITLLNSIGQEIYRGKVKNAGGGEDIVLPLRGYPPGLYQLTVMSAGRISTIRLVISGS